MSMFGFLPNNLYTNHVGANTTGLSPRLWSQVTGSLMASDGSKRLFLVGDDFAGVKDFDTYTDLQSELDYTSYIDTGGTLTGLADEKGGVLALTTDGTDEDEIWIALGDNVQQLGQISDTAADAHLTAFEIRFKISTIADSALSMFAGLMAPGSIGNSTLTDATGAQKDVASIGFRTLLDGDNIAFVYKANGQTLVTKIDSLHVPVADTFVKLGFIYNPDAPADKRIKVYADNVESSTYVTATNIATATFPDAEALNFTAGFKNTTAVAGELAIDWWAFAQLI